jgi:hypothetical protein
LRRAKINPEHGGNLGAKLTGGTGTIPGISGIAIEATVSPTVGVSLIPLNTSAGYTSGGATIAESDSAGSAHFDVVATSVGTYTATLTVRQLVPEGNALGNVLTQLTVQITVTP